MNQIRITRRRLVAVGATLPIAGLLANAASAHDGVDHGAGTPSASPAASPAAPSANTGTGAVYFTILNNRSDEDTLLSASSEAAQSAEIHNMVMNGDVMEMQPVPSGVEIPAGGTLTFEPSSYHLMLVNLNHDLMPDSTFEVTFTFEKAGDITATVHVQTDAPEDPESVESNNVVIQGAWALPAPRITVGSDEMDHEHGHDEGTPAATPST